MRAEERQTNGSVAVLQTLRHCRFINASIQETAIPGRMKDKIRFVQRITATNRVRL
jgi:hypothetical protein